MHRDDVPDQFLQFFRRMQFLSGEMGEIFSQADFITVHRELVHPDVLLREICVVELRPETVRIVVDPFAAESEFACRNPDRWSRLCQCSDACEMAI
jgi:hypothetical protein